MNKNINSQRLLYSRLNWFRAHHISPLLILILCFTPAAFAQRGKITQDEEATGTATSGVAGFFDTNTTTRKHLVFNFPTMGLDYGVTDRLTVGTNGIALFSAANWLLARESPTIAFLHGMARYRLFSTDDWSAALTGYLPVLSLRLQNQQNPNRPRQNIYLPTATLNAAKAYDGGSWGVSLASLLLLEQQGQPGDFSYSDSETRLKLVSLWWKPILDDTLEGELMITTCPSRTELSITSTFRLDLISTCFGPRLFDPIARALVHWRSSKAWLLSGGVLFLPFTSVKYIPLFSLSYSTELFAEPTNGP